MVEPSDKAVTCPQEKWLSPLPPTIWPQVIGKWEGDGIGCVHRWTLPLDRFFIFTDGYDGGIGSSAP